MVLSGLIAAVPCAAGPTLLTTSVSPSTSLSFVSTATVTGVSCGVVAVSFTATGASFTAVTVSVTVAVFESRLPSFALNVKLSGPL